MTSRDTENLILFDDVALVHDAAVSGYDADQTPGECCINALSHPVTSSSPHALPVTCQSSELLTYTTPVSDDNIVVAVDPPLLPPVTAIRPPRPQPTSDLPPPQVSNGDGSSSESDIARRFNGAASVGLGISELFVGVACFALGIAGFIIEINLCNIGAGIWGGLMCCCCGTVGIFAYQMKTNVRISLYMTTSIISSFCGVCIFVISIIACMDMGRSQHPKNDWQANASLGINLMLCILSMIDMTLCLASFAVAARASSLTRSGFCFRQATTERRISDGRLSFVRSGDGSILGVDNDSFHFTERPPPYSPADPPPSYAVTSDDDRNK